MRALGFLLLAAAAASARASDPPAPASDPIAAAKADFAAIKPQAGAQEPASVLPSINASDDGQGSSGVRAGASGPSYPSARSAPDPSGRKEGTGNWLVDAMEKGPDRSKAAPGGMETARGELDLLRDAGGPDAKDARPPEAGERAAAREAFNPLDAFMEGWVSAQDRELLLPAKRGEGRAVGEGAGTLPGFDLGPQGASRGGAQPSRDMVLAEPDSGAANPYVTGLDPAPMKALSLPDTPGFAPLLLPDLSGRMFPPALDSGLLGAPKLPVPDFAQPADDDKYFRQMKRF